MKKRQLTILAAIGILVAAYLLSGYLGSLKKEPEIKKPPTPKKYVETKPVNYNDVKTNVLTYGRIENTEVLDLITEVSGTMQRGNIWFKEGENFRKGELLFKIDDREASLNLKASKSNFIRDLANVLPDLKLDFKESFPAWKEYFGKLDVNEKFPELPEVKSDTEKTFLATKGIYSAFYGIQSTEVRLEKYNVYAPFKGSLVDVALQTGSYVNAGTRVGKIARAGLYEMKASVETRDIPWVIEGAPVEIFSSELQTYFEGEISRISDFVDQNTQSVDVFIRIFPSGSRIYEGQFFQASIPARTVKDGMIMPRGAIYNGNEVFVLKDSSLTVKQVNIVRFMEEEAIVNGLEEGDELVIEQLLGAYNGMKAFKKDKSINLETGGKDQSLVSDEDKQKAEQTVLN